MDFLDKFPSMGQDGLREIKKSIDLGFRDFSRAYGDSLEAFFEPLLNLLVWIERLLVYSPWPLIVIIFGVFAWLASRRLIVVFLTILTFLVIGFFGLYRITKRNYEENPESTFTPLPRHITPLRTELDPTTGADISNSDKI